MQLTFTNKTNETKWKSYLPILKKVCTKAQEELSLSDNMNISVILVKSRAIKKINKDYRKIDKVTDVISFALLDSDDDYEYNDDTIELGDIFINVDRVISQAKDYGHTQKREMAFLFAHGLLHCLGYDHMNPKDEKKMIKAQKLLLDEIVPR